MAVRLPVPFAQARAFALAPSLLQRWHLTLGKSWYVHDVLVPFALTRLALGVVGAVFTWRDWLDAWIGWDAGWYLSIARDGYGHQVGEQSNTAFAPLLPVLMHAVAALLGAPTSERVLFASGILVSNLALLIALGYLVALVRIDFDSATARRAALYALVFPSTLFLSSVYPHALFLAAAVPAFYYARRGRWWLAGALGGLAGLARVQGSVIVLPLLLEYLAAHGYSLKRLRFRLDITAPLLAASGGLGFMLYLWWRVGDPLASMHAQTGWDRHFSLPWEPLLAYVNQPLGPHGSDRSPLDLAFTLLLLGLVALCWTRLRPSLALLASMLLLVALSAGQLTSTMRFGLEMFPIFIALAVSGRFRAFHHAYLATAGYLALRFMSEFAQGGWVA